MNFKKTAMLKCTYKDHVNESSTLSDDLSLYCYYSQLRQAAFTPRGDLSNCNSSLCYKGHTDLVYIIIIGHMDISDGPFQQTTLGGKKCIRFTPTNSGNPTLMAHSCGLGGKYWCKQAMSFRQTRFYSVVTLEVNE